MVSASSSFKFNIKKSSSHNNFVKQLLQKFGKSILFEDKNLFQKLTLI